MTAPFKIMNDTMTVTVEDKMTDMTSEHIDTLKREVDLQKRLVENAKHDLNVIAYILSEVIEYESIETSVISEIINDMQTPRADVINILDGYNVLAEHYFRKDYEVTISIPVSLTMTVEAMSDEEAEEAAMSDLDWNDITDYSLEYNVYYDAKVMEIREV